MASSGKASAQKASGIKIKGQDITRVDFSANLLQQSQLTTKQSKKVPYPPPPPKINPTATITNSQLSQLHQHQQPQLITGSESREKSEVVQATGQYAAFQAGDPPMQLKQLALGQAPSQQQPPRQAQSTKHSQHAIAAYQSAASTINLTNPHLVKVQVGGYTFRQPSHDRQQQH